MYSGIVHRDVKLENLLLAKEGSLEVKLADFGLCKDFSDHALSTMCGSPQYALPPAFSACSQLVAVRSGHYKAMLHTHIYMVMTASPSTAHAVDPLVLISLAPPKITWTCADY